MNHRVVPKVIFGVLQIKQHRIHSFLFGHFECEHIDVNFWLFFLSPYQNPCYSRVDIDVEDISPKKYESDTLQFIGFKNEPDWGYRITKGKKEGRSGNKPFRHIEFSRRCRLSRPNLPLHIFTTETEECATPKTDESFVLRCQLAHVTLMPRS